MNAFVFAVMRAFEGKLKKAPESRPSSGSAKTPTSPRSPDAKPRAEPPKDD
jgi:hypothetical protein